MLLRRLLAAMTMEMHNHINTNDYYIAVYAYLFHSTHMLSSFYVNVCVLDKINDFTIDNFSLRFRSFTAVKCSFFQ